jgi:hypothetical protein
MTASSRPDCLAILLGACKWPQHKEFADGPNAAFERSANSLLDYFRSPRGLALSDERILNLFNTDASPGTIDSTIASFLKERLSTRQRQSIDLVVYYVGHGGFTGPAQDYYLATQHTRLGGEGAGSIRVDDLARTLRTAAPSCRRYVILDACFAGAAYKSFQGGISDIARQMTEKAADLLPPVDGARPQGANWPTSGTALLCAASAQDLASGDGGTYTKFSGALLDVITHGEGNGPALLPLRRVGDLVKHLLLERYVDAARPHVASPDDRAGDVLDVPLFPNPAVDPNGAPTQSALSVPELPDGQISHNGDTDDATVAAEPSRATTAMETSGLLTMGQIANAIYSETSAVQARLGSLPEYMAHLAARRRSRNARLRVWSATCLICVDVAYGANRLSAHVIHGEKLRAALCIVAGAAAATFWLLLIRNTPNAWRRLMTPKDPEDYRGVRPMRMRLWWLSVLKRASLGISEGNKTALKVLIVDAENEGLDDQKELAVALADERRLRKAVEAAVEEVAEWERLRVAALRSSSQRQSGEAEARRLEREEFLEIRREVLRKHMDKVHILKGLLTFRYSGVQALRSLVEVTEGGRTWHPNERLPSVFVRTFANALTLGSLPASRPNPPDASASTKTLALGGGGTESAPSVVPPTVTARRLPNVSAPLGVVLALAAATGLWLFFQTNQSGSRTPPAAATDDGQASRSSHPSGLEAPAIAPETNLIGNRPTAILQKASEPPAAVQQRDSTSSDALDSAQKSGLAVSHKRSPSRAERSSPSDARGAFLRAEAAFLAFRKRNLVFPEKPLGVKKVFESFTDQAKALNEEYQKVSTFGDPNLTLAAALRTGDVYYEFSEKLVRAAGMPSPDLVHLAQQACKANSKDCGVIERQYRDAIYEFVTPVRNEARKRWQDTIARAAQLGVKDNQFVDTARGNLRLLAHIEEAEGKPLSAAPRDPLPP